MRLDRGSKAEMESRQVGTDRQVRYFITLRQVEERKAPDRWMSSQITRSSDNATICSLKRDTL